MERERVVDVNPVDEARMRLLQCRRGAKRMLRILATIEAPSTETEDDMKIARAVLRITKPSEMEMASCAELDRKLYAIQSIIS
jgi:hypothetical protein